MQRATSVMAGTANKIETTVERKTFVCSDESLDVKSTIRRRKPSLIRTVSIRDLIRSMKKMRNKVSDQPKKKNRRDTRNHSLKIVDIATTKCERRKRVIGGDFMNETMDCYGNFLTSVDTWMCREWQLLVFVSSTFTDTKEERNILLDRILPFLRAMAHPHSIEVTFVDMRWGVRDEHTIDHKTWNECQREIARCREESSGLFFLSLQSDKYGYQPLPRKLTKRKFDEIVNACTQPDLVSLAREWYILDENAEPPEYVLKKLQHLDDTYFWRTVLPTLRGILEGIRFDKNSSREIILGRSVSEWEVKYALKNAADASRALWIRRIFSDEYQDDAYCDTSSYKGTSQLKNDLVDWMKRKLDPLNRALVHTHIAHHAMISKNAAFRRYCARWEDEVLGLLGKELQVIIRSKEQWDRDGHGLGLNGQVAVEFLHHSKLAHDLCMQFYGRETVLEEATAICSTGKCALPDTDSYRTAGKTRMGSQDTSETLRKVGIVNTDPGRYSCITLVIAGHPGHGKSAVLAKLANRLYQQERNREEVCGSPHRKSSKPRLDRPVLIRFCGTSANSLQSNSIVRSLRLQLSFLMGPTETVFVKPPTDLEKLHDQMKNYAVILLIDGVDTLPGAFDFLENLSPHPDTRIILSVSAATPNPILEIIALEKIPIITLPTLSSSAIVSTMEKILMGNGRTLRKKQWDHVSSQVAREPTPLYMNLALQVVSDWTSDDVPDLKATLTDVFDQILSKVELECGRIMARKALSLITYSARGINDNEMEDLLSCDQTVLDSVFQYDVPTVSRIPTHVWNRLRRSLEGVLVERHYGCLSWKHSSLQTIAEQRYAQEKVASHHILAEYFGDIIPEHIKRLKKLTASPLLTAGSSIWFTSSWPNHRRCEETVSNYVQAGMLSEAVRAMCNMEFICATFLCNEGLVLMHSLEQLLDKIEAHHMFDESLLAWQDMHRTVRSYMIWLKKSFTIIESDPRMYIPLTVTAEPVDSIARTHYLTHFYYRMVPGMTRATFRGGDCWIRGVCLPVMHLRSGSHIGQQCLRWARCGQSVIAATGDNTIQLWDLVSLEVVQNTRIREHRAVTHMELSTQGDKLITLAWDGSAIMWNIGQGTSMYNMCNNIQVTSAGWKSDGSEYVVGTAEKTLLICRTKDGSRLRESTRFESYPSHVRWSPSGDHIAALTLSKHVRVWNLKTNDVKSFSQHSSQVQSLCWSPDGVRIASASDDSKVAIWAATDLKIKHKMFEAHRCPVTSVHWCQEGGRIVSGDTNGCIYVWCPDNGIILHSWSSSNASPILSVEWNFDSNKLLSISTDGIVVIYDSLSERDRNLSTSRPDMTSRKKSAMARKNF